MLALALARVLVLLVLALAHAVARAEVSKPLDDLDLVHAADDSPAALGEREGAFEDALEPPSTAGGGEARAAGAASTLRVQLAEEAASMAMLKDMIDEGDWDPSTLEMLAGMLQEGGVTIEADDE